MPLEARGAVSEVHVSRGSPGAHARPTQKLTRKLTEGESDLVRGLVKAGLTDIAIVGLFADRYEEYRTTQRRWEQEYRSRKRAKEAAE